MPCFHAKAVTFWRPIRHMAGRSRIGLVAHYYGKMDVAVVQLRGEPKSGDSIEIGRASTKLSQKVTSVQMNHKEVSACKPGDDVGMKVDWKVREGDAVYKVS